MSEEIILGLTQGDITSIAIVAAIALLALLLLGAFLKLSAQLFRLGCLFVVLVVLVFALTRMSGS